MSSEKEEPAAPPRKLSCTKHFDALYFCYSPYYQMKQYYQLGELDNCFGKWRALYDCLYLKTKRASQVEEILEAREKAQHHIWTFRTPNEAKSYWKKHYGHLDDLPRQCWATSSTALSSDNGREPTSVAFMYKEEEIQEKAIELLWVQQSLKPSQLLNHLNYVAQTSWQSKIMCRISKSSAAFVQGPENTGQSGAEKEFHNFP